MVGIHFMDQNKYDTSTIVFNQYAKVLRNTRVSHLFQPLGARRSSTGSEARAPENGGKQMRFSMGITTCKPSWPGLHPSS